MSKKLTTEEFIKRAKQVHGGKYCYDNTIYNDSKTKVLINCPIHGNFLQNPDSHLHGVGCKKCGYEKSSKNNNLGIKEFIKRAKEIHGNKYDYSNSIYIKAHSKIKIICPIHGEFVQIAHDHLDGHGCKKCADISTKEKQKNSTKNFIEIANRKHGNKYDYSKVEYKNCKKKVCIICPKHGDFYQSPIVHIKGCGCPMCQNSKMEDTASKILKNKNIEFSNRHHFSWLRRQHLDFYLNQYNVAIECQGEQHFKGWGGEEESLKEIQNRDKKKKQLCEKNGVKLYYINYNEDVETKLNEILKEVCL